MDSKNHYGYWGIKIWGKDFKRIMKSFKKDNVYRFHKQLNAANKHNKPHAILLRITEDFFSNSYFFQSFETLLLFFLETVFVVL